MNIHNIMDSAYIIPVLFDHIEKPTEITKAILRQKGITKKVVEEFKALSSLMEYHKNRKQDYPLLQHGLKAYYQQHLSSMFNELGLVAQEMVVLDYGAGSGVVSDQFFTNNPHSVVYRVDRTDYTGDTIVRDFEKTPNWYAEFLNNFDLVILSEVLHCKQSDIQEYLIRSSKNMLKEKGKLLIVENIDHCMAWRISKFKNQLHPVVGPSRVTELTKDNFILLQHIQLGRHIIYLYQRL